MTSLNSTEITNTASNCTLFILSGRSGSGAVRWQLPSHLFRLFFYSFSLSIHSQFHFLCVARPSPLVELRLYEFPVNWLSVILCVSESRCVCVNVLFNCIIVINLPVAKLINFRLATFKILFFFFFVRSFVSLVAAPLLNVVSRVRVWAVRTDCRPLSFLSVVSFAFILAYVFRFVLLIYRRELARLRSTHILRIQR